MTQRIRLYFFMGVALTLLGGCLVAVGVAQEVFAFRLLDDPILPGAGIGAVGAVLTAGVVKRSQGAAAGRER